MERTSRFSTRPGANLAILLAWIMGFKLLIESGIGWYSGAHYDDLKVVAGVALLAPLVYTGIVLWMLAMFEYYMLSIVISIITLSFFILMAITILSSY